MKFWTDASWRSFRSFLHALAGGLVMTNATSAFQAPWWGLIGAGLIAALLSLAQSVDRGRAVYAAEENISHEQVEPVPGVEPMPFGSPHSSTGIGCGDDLR